MAAAEPCNGRTDALGTSRVIVVDPKDHPRVGTVQYPQTLPLGPREVVLTFDDGPLPAYTARVLEALAEECVRATFFMVGRMARAYPEWVRRVYNAGHSVGTHTQRHLGLFNFIAKETAVVEIADGIASTEAALGDRNALSPFFRFPGLRTTRPLEQHLAARGISVWSMDVPSDDWRSISAEEVIERSIARLEKKDGGVLLLHDIQSRTALALPGLLRELKARGFKIVHVVAPGERPARLREPEVVARREAPSVWPVARAPAVRATAVAELPLPSAASFGFPHLFGEEAAISAGEKVLSFAAPRAALGWPGVQASPASSWPLPPPDALAAGPHLAGAGPDSLAESRWLVGATALLGGSRQAATQRARRKKVVRTARAAPPAPQMPASGPAALAAAPAPQPSSPRPGTQRAGFDHWQLRLNWFQ